MTWGRVLIRDWVAEFAFLLRGRPGGRPGGRPETLRGIPYDPEGKTGPPPLKPPPKGKEPKPMPGVS